MGDSLTQGGVARDFQDDIAAVRSIEAVPTILDVVCRTTGLRFAAVARVTDSRWIACEVLDLIDFGLKPGGELKVETTICHEIRQSREPVLIDHVAEDVTWCNHATPAMYGFQSYVSVPIVLADGTFFGTLCAIDPRPARVRTPETLGMFRLFADLIAKHLEAYQKLAASESALLTERADAALREQFIAVLGHDLRSPMIAIRGLVNLLLQKPLDDDTAVLARLMRTSSARMLVLIDNLLDLARGRLAGGLTLQRDHKEPLEPVLRAVIAEVNAGMPGRVVTADFRMVDPVDCDRSRIAQLLSNLLTNALTYGSPKMPVRVQAICHPDRFELTVANAGDPIPPAAMERLFQPFYRSTVMRNGEGLGLGLYIADQVAKAHGGTLTVESSSDETRFTFRMPLSDRGDSS